LDKPSGFQKIVRLAALTGKIKGTPIKLTLLFIASKTSSFGLDKPSGFQKIVRLAALTGICG